MIQSEAKQENTPALAGKLSASETALAALEARRREAVELEAQLQAERVEASETAAAKRKGPAVTAPKSPLAAALAADVARLISSVDDEPDAGGWSPKRDALLLQLRKDRGLAWSAISIPAGDGRFHSERKCQKRFALLVASANGVRAAVAAVRSVEVVERDGLDWLQRKGRLTPARRAAGERYRQLLRDAGDAVIKSCLNVTVGGVGPNAVEVAAVGSADAKRELFRLRWAVLGGQSDLLTVMDGVCGAGQTLRQLAGEGSDDQVKQRAKVLEAVLIVALDLVAHQLGEGDVQAAA